MSRREASVRLALLLVLAIVAAVLLPEYRFHVAGLLLGVAIGVVVRSARARNLAKPS